MKRFYFSFLLSFFICALASAQTANVTFTVDVSNETVVPEGMRLAGDMTGWNDTTMTDNLDGTWSVTLELPSNTNYGYKFKNGPGGWEDFAGVCNNASFGNRTLTVGEENDTLGTVCFNSCFACGIQAVTVSVDMANETVDPTGVFIAGDHNGWTDGAMTDNGNGTWSGIIVLATGATSGFKFKNGPNGWESFDGDCLTGGAGSNRFVVGPAADSTAATACFNSCDPCSNPTGPVNVTFTVDMSNETVSPEGVRMAGSFTGWTDTLMTDNLDGTWSLTLEFNSGTLAEYKFKNGSGGWESFGGPCLIGGAGSNRFLNVPANDVSLGTVCFNSCYGCGMVGVVLTVDMQFETVAAEGIFLAGEHNGWTDGAMKDNGDGTWTGYFGAMPGDTSEYKFKNGPSGWENFNGDCLIGGNGSNRFIGVPAQDTTAETVCFNLCEPCIVLDSVNITFRVDLIEETVSPQGVFLAGSFNNFVGTPMMDMGNGVWALQLVLIPGETVTYKFQNGVDGFEVITETGCTDGSFSNNRVLIVPPQHRVLDAVCFGKCGVCFDPTSVTSAVISESCMNPDGTVTIVFDDSKNCDTAPGDLAGMAEIGFHSGANQWGSTIDWNAPTAQRAINNGNDIFSVTIDPAAYYGLDVANINNIFMVFNQGPAFPDPPATAPWESEGKDQDLDENGSCDDIRLFIDQLPACSFDPTTTSSSALKSPGSCTDPELGLVRVRFDYALACANAPGDLSGMAEIGFHSGANSWTSANTVEWNAPNAINAVNNGSDVFEVILDPVAYYGLASFGDLANIYMVFNQGPANPGSAWDAKGEDTAPTGNCTDLRFIVSDLPTCDLTNTIDRELESSLVAVPNPFNDKTIVTFSNPTNASFEVTLMGLTGKQIRTFQNVTGSVLEIARNEMPAGMYFLTFSHEDGKMATLKLVVK